VSELPEKIKLWKHQRDGVHQALKQRDFALFYEMGCGKSATTINILRQHYASNNRIMRTLILGPIVIMENWRREFMAHSNVGPYVQILKGSEKARIKTFNFYKDTKPAPIFITNYEALNMKELLQELLNWRPEILVCDESQRLKNPTAKRSKYAAMLSDVTKHNYILSGTPILNSAMDIFAQYRVLDRGETFGRNFRLFQAKYFYDENAGMPPQKHFPKWSTREGVLEEFNRLIYNKAMRVTKDECLDLPPLVRTIIPVELGAEQRRVYEEMKKEFIAYLNTGEAVVAQVAITKALRLQQIVSGYVKTEEGEEVQLKENPRLDALQDILEDRAAAEKIIIWACFHENYEQLAGVCRKLGLDFVELHGGVPSKMRQHHIDRFQTDPACRIMIANAGAGGVGINLTAASSMIFYSRTFSLEHDLQAEARNHRGGSEIHKKITRIDLLAEGTIDQLVLEALQSKMDLSSKIIDLKNKL
jgi:SNF2 family DNA or RNA helicase